MMLDISVADPTPRIVLIAHDACKDDLVEWAVFNRATLERCELLATGTTGARVAEATGLPIDCLLSGAFGGDAQVGAMIAERRLDFAIFFWDPLSSQPHDVDVKALLRLAVLHNLPIACNRASADFLISSPLFFALDHPRGTPMSETAYAEAALVPAGRL